jgi:hypothetical protein
MSLHVEVEYDVYEYPPTFTFVYSADGIRCSAEYSEYGRVDADDWRRFAHNLGLIIPDNLDFSNDNGGSSITFDGTEVSFSTSNNADGIGSTHFSIVRDRCLESFQCVIDILDEWEANVDL